ncbi:MAG: hypothetical protein AB1481_07280, partial [Candidatus Omnitrophota bacterium]
AALAIGMILAFYLAQEFKVPQKVLFTMIIACVLGSISELAKRQELVFSLIFTFVLFVIGILYGKRITPVLFSRKMLILLSAIAFTAVAALEPWYTENEFSRYPKTVKYSGFWPEATEAWEWLNLETAANNIAYVGRPVPLPLYGSKFKNNVYYVSVNSQEPAKLHYFPESRYHWGKDYEGKHKNFEEKGNYRGNADCITWLKNIEKKKTDYLFVYSLHQIKGIEFPIEDAWARKNPVQFQLVYEKPSTHIYKIVR